MAVIPLKIFILNLIVYFSFFDDRLIILKPHIQHFLFLLDSCIQVFDEAHEILLPFELSLIKLMIFSARLNWLLAD